ncbi:hypothetical protein ABZ467_24260 [Streptomyces sp. NPDC005727]|uniref:hypothetical protein n=1 Tax=Streptomyces sp. NPDC005727 TaxID=3157053 RepID=UPI0033C6C856
MYELVNYLLHDFGKRDDIQDLLDELDPLAPEKVKATEVQDLVRRDYDSIQWYAVPIVGSPFASLVGEEVVPVFVVRYGGLDYDFRRMGLGELSAHLLMWILSYSKGSGNQAILLDEPEAFLPAPSRTVLLAHLLETCINGGTPLVIASHSLELIQPALDADAAIMLTSRSAVSELTGPSEELRDKVAGLYGQSIQVEWIIFLEDEAACLFLQEILRAVEPRLWQSCRLLWCSGYGDLESIWSRLPKPSVDVEGIPSFAFIADGDKQDDVTKAIAKMNRDDRPHNRWPFLCLPGDPDVLMKEDAIKQVNYLSTQLGKTKGLLEGFFESIQGREAHNWVEEFITFSGRSRQEALKLLSATVVRSRSKASLRRFLSPLR